MRDYETMRGVLHIAAKAKPGEELCFNDFKPTDDDARLKQELERLTKEGLLLGNVHFAKDAFDNSACSVTGLTDEGKEFYRLIENDKVWTIVFEVLKEAKLDLSYPFLKDVCEEVVRRYVASFIPEIKGRK